MDLGIATSSYTMDFSLITYYVPNLDCPFKVTIQTKELTILFKIYAFQDSKSKIMTFFWKSEELQFEIVLTLAGNSQSKFISIFQEFKFLPVIKCVIHVFSSQPNPSLFLNVYCFQIKNANQLFRPSTLPPLSQGSHKTSTSCQQAYFDFFPTRVWP